MSVPIYHYGLILLISAFASATADNHECSRPCHDGSPKVCRYEFFITEFSVNSRCNATEINDESETCKKKSHGWNHLVINGRSPGPQINVCVGDTIEVLVHNRLRADELAFHWHGIRQKNFAHMDGVPMVTQCPILPYNGFRYKIRPESIGTFFYHAHSVSQQADGLYGSLTVRGPQDDPTLERMLLLSSRPPTPLTRHSHLYYPPTPKELLVNGQTRESALHVAHGARYLLRLVNANAYNCPLLLSTSGHFFRALAADGNPVQTTTGQHILLFPGERLDAKLEANQTPGKYVIDVQGLQDCQDLHHEVLIIYENANSTEVLKRPSALNKSDLAILERGHDCYKASDNVICTLDLRSPGRISMEKRADEVFYVPFDLSNFNAFTDDMTDDSYDLEGPVVFYPAYLGLHPGEIQVPQINGMSFKYPSSPILSQPENAPKDMMCSLEKRSVECEDTPFFCECLQIVELPPRRNVEVILINEGFGGNASYVFYLHGYNASVLGRRSFGRPVKKEEILSLDDEKKLHRNFVNPVKKDTVIVPNKGYVILRFYTDNVGYWLWEARSTMISPATRGPGMQFLMRIGSRENLPTVPINFPTCGSNKKPDVLFDFDWI